MALLKISLLVLLNLSAATVWAIAVPTVTPQVSGVGTPIISGSVELEEGMGFQVVVDGEVYVPGDGNLNVSTSAWELAIPVQNALAVGTYDVVASTFYIGSEGSAIQDNTSYELRITPIAVAGKLYEASATAEKFQAGFQQSTATANQYSGLVQLTVSGFGKSLGSANNDAFYIFGGTPRNDEINHQLAIDSQVIPGPTIGPSPSPAQHAKALIVADLDAGIETGQPHVPDYRADHIYTFVIDVSKTEAAAGSTLPSLLHFAVADGGYGDNSGAYTIEVLQLREVAPWEGTGETLGGPQTRITVVNDGSDGRSPEFSYTNRLPDGSETGCCGSGEWKFTTVAKETGPVTLRYKYSGSNAYYQVRVGLQAFVAGGEPVELVNDGPVNCCAAPSGSFSYTGEVTLNVVAGQVYGFRMTGSNGDRNSTNRGTLVVNPQLQSEDGIPVINSSPVASVPENTGTNETVLAVTASEPVIYRLIAEKDYSLFDISAQGNISFKTSPDFENPTDLDLDNAYQLTVEVEDSVGFLARQFITISVTDINEDPVIEIASTLITQEDSSGALTFTYIDAEGDTVTASEAAAPANGAISIAGDTITYTPNPDFNGVDEFTITLADGEGFSADRTINVTVEPQNDAPQAVGSAADITLEWLDSAFIPFSALEALFVDIDGDALSFSALSSDADLASVNFEEGGLRVSSAGFADGTATIGITASDSAEASAIQSFNVTVEAEVFGEAELLQVVTNPANGQTLVAVRVTGAPGSTTQRVELLTSDACVDGELQDLVEFAEFGIEQYNEEGIAEKIAYIPAPEEGVPAVSSFVTARIGGDIASGGSSACIVAGADNDSWLRALELESTDSITDRLNIPGNTRWYRFPIQPGAKVTVEITGLPRDYDLFVFKDISQAFDELEGEQDVDGLNQLSAEFAPSVFSPSVFSPSVFSPSVFSPDAYSPSVFSEDQFSPSVFSPSVFSPSVFSPSVFSPSVFSPSVFSPSVFSPSVFSPSVFSPSVFSPSVFSPSVFSPSVFSPSVFSAENFASAQIRSMLAVSAQQGTGSERVTADTWNNTGYFYVRVSGKNGAYDVSNAYQLSVNVDGVDCTGVKPIPGTVAASASDKSAIIIWDSQRVADDSQNSTADFDRLQANLLELAARVNGTIVDLSDPAYGHIQDLNRQATDNPSCPYAENLTANAIKDVIDAYRDPGLNPDLAYIVLVGADDHVPFFRYPDQALLGPEQDYDPPMADGTQSQSALRLNYIMGQDEYGASTTLSLRDGFFPVPDLAVGRLVETAADMNTVLEAYFATGDGVVDQPQSTLVTGYDFLTDSATAVHDELVLGTSGARNDTLITAADVPPSSPLSWTATDLSRELLDEGEDIIFLAGHFSANSTLAADYSTTLVVTSLASAGTDLTNSIVFSGGCHSGYNIVNGEAVPDVTLLLDWTQAFAQKGATLIAGTGYQYGDTDFIEYSERLYLEFARQLRTGSGPVSVGEALVRAKQQYLANTPDVRGLHRKSVLISTVFGLPMLSVDLAGERISDQPADPTIQAEPVPAADLVGAALGLQTAELEFDFASGADGTLTRETVNLTNLSGPDLVATYLRGPAPARAVVTNPAEPAIPLVSRDVTAANQRLSLRGVGFRGGAWTEEEVVPLTGAPTTELRGVHTPFTSPVNFPMRLANANYYDALSGNGKTILHVTPAQHRAKRLGEAEAILREFGSLNFRLYYSDNTRKYPSVDPDGSGDPEDTQFNTPALAAPPSLSSVKAVLDEDTGDIVFLANVVGDPAAGIHEVWVTYTESGVSSGTWLPLDLTQDADDSTLWKGWLAPEEQPAGGLYYMLQAVNGTGLVTLDDNYGAYYELVGFLDDVEDDGELPPALQGSTLGLQTTASSGNYGGKVGVDVQLFVAGDSSMPIVDAPVFISIGATGRIGFTDDYGSASVELPLNAVPGDYVITASYAGDALNAAVSAEVDFEILKTATVLTRYESEDIPELQSVEVEGILPGTSVILTDVDSFGDPATPLLQRTVYFRIEGGPEGDFTVPVITDNLGRARLGPLALPGGSYDVSAFFLGNIPVGDDGATLNLVDDIYESSSINLGLELDGGDCPVGPYGTGKNSKRLDITGFCYLTEDVGSDIRITDGTLVVGAGVSVGKKIEQKGAGSVYVLESATVDKKIDEEGAGDIVVHGSVREKLDERGDGGVTVAESGSVNKNVDEKGAGSITISGQVGGNVKEEDSGDLTVTPGGEVDGDAHEKGEGVLTNEGWVSGRLKGGD